ncbi:hypothetical protein A3I46_01230 [Candidatus Kaiserbacteria bacterium RIFCSPLOWO2_02_FULL_54_13]|uniref:Glycosyltransferase subfamily 4-like N-terminal domain-containing protein n=1 Tax=Candidatus Kaiserbacteria bacterium RIFCSPHIGHO2_02_FULL_54_22 TaxID=1798495 RepID=A0A1F6DJ30_9BACT|nr:MAG: hypothetical protein A3C19_01675 [Candidatus Kaiserbacteria bacterium RIFCSPHIGHO2_02_FULL_54_22]OGG68547.1 MAG: hypothetical protein A3E99_00185 [Candidatus Kaiserbacteria bacterium RIFCSPHIGHO2_12_FULL_54_16]OGG83958.1 MAG: hypothetical protein A3I46_01230 [Candidatus Kaiserbacteria bacterium RIFCSPLOWO2_02_FULL_54_13]OGG89913.1 MAG: hypothetical protein A3G12_01570 [Candidatus Kaiserbacteria bacterium RIFCSPLOWO2_12_FULL_54_10]
MKIYYIANARMPSEKAYGIQLAKMCEAFIEQGIEVELCIPRTLRSHLSLKEFYGLRVYVPTRTFLSFDWYDRGSVGFALSSLTFMASVCLYLLRHRGSALVYTIDMDPYSFAPLALLGAPIAVEMHSPKIANVLTRLFFKRANYIIATNPLTREKIASVFSLRPERFIVEPNGVDPSAFNVPSKEDARKECALPAEANIALYVGRFYDWKGMPVLQRAAVELKKNGVLTYLIGGTQEEFERRTGGPSVPLHFGGSVEHKSIVTWCAAADVLLILGTRANEFSYHYTAPMKLFEYMATGRPVVAANTPALRSLVSEEDVVFYAPDDPVDLARKVYAVCSSPEESTQAIMNRLQKAREHLWSKRAARIGAFIGA